MRLRHVRHDEARGLGERMSNVVTLREAIERSNQLTGEVKAEIEATEVYLRSSGVDEMFAGPTFDGMRLWWYCGGFYLTCQMVRDVSVECGPKHVMTSATPEQLIAVSDHLAAITKQIEAATHERVTKLQDALAVPRGQG